MAKITAITKQPNTATVPSGKRVDGRRREGLCFFERIIPSFEQTGRGPQTPASEPGQISRTEAKDAAARVSRTSRQERIENRTGMN